MRSSTAQKDSSQKVQPLPWDDSCLGIPWASIRYSSHQRTYHRYLLTGYYWYMVAREYDEESSLGIGKNEILQGIMELGLWFGNILVIVVRGQLNVIRW